MSEKIETPPVDDLASVLQSIAVSSQKTVALAEGYGELANLVLDQNGKFTEQLQNFFNEKEAQAKSEELAQKDSEIQALNEKYQAMELALDEAKRKSAMDYGAPKSKRESYEAQVAKIATVMADVARMEHANNGFSLPRQHNIVKDRKLNVTYSGVQISDEPIDIDIDCDTPDSCYASFFRQTNKDCLTPEERIRTQEVNGTLQAWRHDFDIDKSTLTFSEDTKDLYRFHIAAIFEDLPDNCFHSTDNSKFIDLIMKGWFEKRGEAIDTVVAGYDPRLSLPPYSVGVGAIGNNTGLAPLPASITLSTKFDRVLWGIMQLKQAKVPSENIKVILSHADYFELLLLQNNGGYLHQQLMSDCNGNVKCPFGGQIITCGALDGRDVAHWIDNRNGILSTYGDMSMNTYVDIASAKRNKKMMRIEEEFSFYSFCASKFIVNSLS